MDQMSPIQSTYIYIETFSSVTWMFNKDQRTSKALLLHPNNIIALKVRRAKGYFTHDINGGGDNMYTADNICKMIEFLINNIFVQFGGRLFRQAIGIPMGTNCAPLLADLFLYSYENEFLDNMIRSGHRRLARSFNLCYRYIDDLIVFNNKKFLDCFQ